MAQDERVKIAAKAQSELGMIPGTQFYSPFPFGGMNVQASRIAIDDKEFGYVENLFRIGDGKIRAGWDVGTPIYTASDATIIMFFAYNIGVTNYFAVFLDDGTAFQVNASTQAVTEIGSEDASFFDPETGFFPAVTQWGTLYLLISNRNTRNDYWIWDGSLFYESGTVAPNGVTVLNTGLNYSSAPTVTAYGGQGNGAVFSAKINAGGVVEVDIVDPGSGYQVVDVPQLAFSGGGSDRSAILSASIGGGSVASVLVTDGGSGYSSATVTFSAPSGLVATGISLISGGRVSSVKITNPGAGYTVAPTVTFSGGGGSGAAGHANINAIGAVTSVTITNVGSGYTAPPTVSFSVPGGTTATGTVTLTGDSVTSVEITDPGSGYTSAPSVTISGDGTGATAVAYLVGSSVSEVIVVDGGTGFLFAPTITFVGGGGHGATGTVVLTGTGIARIEVVNGGANYKFVPTVHLFGGGGTGANATAFVAGGQVIAVTVTNPGSGYTTNPEVFFVPDDDDNTGAGASAVAIFNPTSIASVTIGNHGLQYTDAPAAVITPGANNAAYASLALMPYGVSGNAIETFQSRVWIANPAPSQFSTLPVGGNFALSAPGSVTDFATSDGGLLFSNTDNFLQTKYVAIRQSNGYLYFLGDGSVSVISNVQTSGSPATTTFNYQNVDPQIGISWRDSRQDFSRTILFGNETGIYGLYGGAVTKISDKLDQLFVDAIFPPTSDALTPTSASATVFDVKHYFMLMTVLDPDSGQFRNVMATWNERDWTLSSQSISLTYIGTQKIGSKLYAWGTDGTKLYPLFNAPSATLTKRLDTKLYGANEPFMNKNFLDFYIQVRDFSSAQAGVSFSVNLDIGGIQTQRESGRVAGPSVPSAEVSGAGLIQPPNFAAGSDTTFFPTFGAGTGGIPFIVAGLNFTTTSPDFVLGNMMMAWHRLSVNQ